MRFLYKNDHQIRGCTRVSAVAFCRQKQPCKCEKDSMIAIPSSCRVDAGAWSVNALLCQRLQMNSRVALANGVCQEKCAKVFYIFTATHKRHIWGACCVLCVLCLGVPSDQIRRFAQRAQRPVLSLRIYLPAPVRSTCARVVELPYFQR